MRKLACSVLVIFAVLALPARAEPIQVGEQAPDFFLPSTTGGNVRLSDFRGQNVVLIEFYHSDWGPRCTANLAQRRDDFDEFAGLDIVVLAISITNAYSQAAFAQSLGLQFPLLSDYPDGDTILAYGVEDFEGEAQRLYARPSFFLIDKEGIIRGYWGQRPANLDEVVAPDPLFSSGPILELARTLSR